MALKKPKKPFMPMGTVVTPGQRSLFNKFPNPPKPAAPKAPAAPTSPAAPGIPAGSKPTDPGLPLNMSEQAQRNAAESTYTAQKGGYGRQLYEAALRYGDPGVMSLYSQYGPTVENPNSRLSTILRGENQNIEQSGLRSNANNTFFSGLHLRADQEIRDQASRERLAAQQEYESAMNELNNLMLQAENERAGVYGSTGASAIDRELEREPVPGAAAPPKKPAASKPAGGGGGGGGISEAEYLRGLRAIRDRHGANSAEVQRYRKRHGR